MPQDPSPREASATPSVDAVEEQARGQTGQRQVRVRIDESDRVTTYANAFRSNGTEEEVILDFGMNSFNPGGRRGDGDAQVVGEVLFEVDQRVVLNYFTAKRLAINLGQIVRRYEEEYGELKLNAAERRVRR